MKTKIKSSMLRAGLKSFLVILLFSFFISVAQARPPYEVVGYALQTTMAPSNSVNDNGQGANINWTTDIPWQDLTVVSDAFAIPSTGNTFDMSEAKVASLITPAHNNGVRCIISVGGGSQDSAFSTLCLPANRQAFASAVTAMMMNYGYDGVDIDWEVDTNQQADATAMMQDIYAKVKALPNSTVDGKPRTLAFTTVDYISNIYNMTTLGNYTDWCFFMGYDWGACPELATGPLDAIASEINSLTNGSQWGYPISKMIFGCPLYCDHYTGSNCNAGEYDTLSILHLGTPGAYNSTWAEQAYTYAGGTVYVDTAQSYCDKTNWALNHGLRGIGMWDMAQALPYTDSTVSGIWNVIGGNAGCLNLGPTATPTMTATPVVSSTWRVNAGGPQYTDSLGHLWAADENYTGGTAAVTTSTITGSLPGAGDQSLYQSQRYGSPFTYTFNVPAGSYQITLKFAETYWTAAGKRVFNVLVNGTTVLTNFDIYAAAGGQNKAIDEVFNNIAPTGGVITIQLGPASADNAEVNAIQIIAQPATATPTPTFSKTATMTFTSSPTTALTSTFTSTSTLSPTATQTNSYTATATWTNSHMPVFTATSTNTLSATATRTNSNTATSTNTLTYTSTPTWTATFTFSSTPVNTSTGTVTAVNTSTATSTSSNTSTATFTGTSTSSPTATFTNTLTKTNTPVSTPTATSTLAANTSTFTFTPSSTVTNTPTATRTATATSTNSSTATSTATASATWTYTATKTLSPTATWTNTSTSTATQAVPTKTNTPVPPTTTKTATPAAGCSGIPNWNGGFVAYSIGQKVDYNGEVYQCIQSHTSEPTWEPNVVPALWKDLGACGSTAPTLAAAQPVVYPNPVTSSTASIQLPVSNASNVTVQVFTVAMRQVQSVNVSQVIGDTLTVRTIDKSGINLANGLYYFVIQANGQKWTNKVLILR